MNTKSLKKSNNLKEEFDSLFIFKSEEKELQHDEFILMSGYLSEIERLKKPLGINRKKLAHKIKVSAPYLTQVFRGDKPLNFATIAKIQKVLNIKFEVRAKVIEKKQIFFDFELKSTAEILNVLSSKKEYTNTGGTSVTSDKSNEKEFEKSVVYG